ncbi:MAG: prolyl oligopeptidase family serine peptidase, partial [Acidimicrobiia bacterium]|nr:prolyl oligopeptidase family serine peptidase [Acidimicrobiia bacterium]
MITPYGAWTSPISPEQLAGGQLSFFELSGYDGGVIWSEFRPAESGRVAIMRHRNGTTEELGHGFNARTLVHEYGGASAATDGHVVIATRYEDQRMYGIDGAEPIPITPEPPTPRGWRYADAVIAGDWVVAVREDHTGPGEPQNCLVAFPLDGESDPVVVASGNDFYSSPRISPDGATVAWIAWDHPNMPWDATHLWVADWRAPEARNSRMIPGEADESFFQPTWTPDNHLLVSADRTGWWNVYRVDGDALIAVASGERECGLPGWQFGMASFAVTDDVRLVTAVADEGMWSIEIDGVPVDLGSRQAFGGNITVGAGRIWAVVGGPTNPMSLITIDLESGGFDVIRQSSDMTLADGYVSRPEPIAFPTSDGDTAHAFFYPPVNADHTPPDGELPPLIVFSHGGPTSQTQPALNLGVQFWTTRGFAVADVNYRGSTGYGRAYRDALRGRWGDVDVVDCVETARYLAATGRVDGDRLAIRGGSAGGYVTLCAL